MRMRLRPALAAAVVLAVTGLCHGIRTDRWGVCTELVEATARLQRIPLAVGEWEGKPYSLDERELRVAQVSGHRAMQFVHRVSAQKATLMVLCGRPGAISSHTPDICFEGQGFRMQSAPVRQAVRASDGSSAEFWTAPFVRAGSAPQQVRVWWAWGTAGEWRAVEPPRLVFALRPVLYKMYVISPIPGPEQSPQDNAATKLIAAILPPIRSTLCP